MTFRVEDDHQVKYETSTTAKAYNKAYILGCHSLPRETDGRQAYEGSSRSMNHGICSTNIDRAPPLMAVFLQRPYLQHGRTDLSTGLLIRM